MPGEVVKDTCLGVTRLGFESHFSCLLCDVRQVTNQPSEPQLLICKMRGLDWPASSSPKSGVLRVSTKPLTEEGCLGLQTGVFLFQTQNLTMTDLLLTWKCRQPWRKASSPQGSSDSGLWCQSIKVCWVTLGESLIPSLDLSIIICKITRLAWVTLKSSFLWPPVQKTINTGAAIFPLDLRKLLVRTSQGHLLGAFTGHSPVTALPTVARTRPHWGHRASLFLWCSQSGEDGAAHVTERLPWQAAQPCVSNQLQEMPGSRGVDDSFLLLLHLLLPSIHSTPAED
ncbi:uncharacterized protein LOC114036304 [Vombatus ursinus]|uniref:uncharacterized protein LOC114036304 n=1 Tax=Vombatus ursinus TaxID=29139 RepID=UPI000FFD5A5A|nr:uncharacterized protein LOC114036304 [Vombatus ursinus]